MVGERDEVIRKRVAVVRSDRDRLRQSLMASDRSLGLIKEVRRITSLL